MFKLLKYALFGIGILGLVVVVIVEQIQRYVVCTVTFGLASMCEDEDEENEESKHFEPIPNDKIILLAKEMDKLRQKANNEADVKGENYRKIADLISGNNGGGLPGGDGSNVEFPKHLCGNVSSNGKAIRLSSYYAVLGPALEAETQRQGIPEWAELIKALVMQETQGNYVSDPDVMQASEGHCGVIGCISDMATSIRIGVGLFKERSALSNFDMKLAIQVYNYGKGFVSYANARGGYSEQVAKDFSLKEAAKNPGLYNCRNNKNDWRYPYCYGDYKYVEHVLSYYQDNGCTPGQTGPGGTTPPPNPNGGTPPTTTQPPTDGNGNGGVVPPTTTPPPTDGTTPPTTGEPPKEDLNKKADQVIEIAKKYLGVPYVFGGEDPKTGLDCSAFTRLVFKEVGINLPRTAAEQIKVGKPVEKAELRKGDLVFLKGTYGGDNHISHVMIYMGDGKLIEEGGKNVHISDLNGPYNLNHYAGATRVLGENDLSNNDGTVDNGKLIAVGDMTEAEIHLRAMIQTDFHVLLALDSEDHLTADYINKKLKDSNLKDTWKLAEKKFNLKSDEKFEKKASKLMNARKLVYQCYFVGDEEVTVPWVKLFFGWLTWLQDGACEQIEEAVPGMIAKDDQGKLTQIIIKEIPETRCVKIPEPPPTPGGPITPEGVNGTRSYKNTDLQLVIDAGDGGGGISCGAGERAETVIRKEKHIRYPSLTGILYDFETYALIEVGKTAVEDDLKYKELIDYYLKLIYEELGIGVPGPALPGGGGGTSGGGGDDILISDGYFGPPMDEKSYRTTSYYGEVRGGAPHKGIDLGAPMGTPIYSVADGTVILAGPAGGYGKVVVISHPLEDGKGNVVMEYGHMRDIFVTTGQTVKKGQKIAGVGSEGESTGPHLHIGANYPCNNWGKTNGCRVDPGKFLKLKPMGS